MVNMNQLMNQAKMMQQKMQAMQEELAKQEFEGSSGAGMVKIVVDGKGNLKSVKIAPEMLEEEVDMLEDLVLAAFQDAKQKADKSSEDSMGSMLPAGFKMPF